MQLINSNTSSNVSNPADAFGVIKHHIVRVRKDLEEAIDILGEKDRVFESIEKEEAEVESHLNQVENEKIEMLQNAEQKAEKLMG